MGFRRTYGRGAILGQPTRRWKRRATVGGPSGTGVSTYSPRNSSRSAFSTCRQCSAFSFFPPDVR